MSELAKLKNLSEWPKLRSAIESVVQSHLGGMPKERTDLQAKIVDELPGNGYVRRRVNYFIDEWERVAAWMYVPEGKDEAPAILCCHQAVPQGKDEPAGLEGSPALAYAKHYAQLGYVTLAPDCITAGERVSLGLKAYDTAHFYKENPKMSAWGKMLWDHMHAIDLLCDTKRVDPARLGVIGHGLGAQNALFLVAFDERVQVAVASCGFTRLQDDPNPERWVEDGNFVCCPRLKEAVKKRSFPFDLEDILGLCAPSPTLLITALNDATLANTRSCDKAVGDASKIYKLLGAPGALRNYSHDQGRSMPSEALQEADEWFERWL